MFSCRHVKELINKLVTGALAQWLLGVNTYLSGMSQGSCPVGPSDSLRIFPPNSPEEPKHSSNNTGKNMIVVTMIKPQHVSSRHWIIVKFRHSVTAPKSQVRPFQFLLLGISNKLNLRHFLRGHWFDSICFLQRKLLVLCCVHTHLFHRHVAEDRVGAVRQKTQRTSAPAAAPIPKREHTEGWVRARWRRAAWRCAKEAFGRRFTKRVTCSGRP